jgi:hypothetical protein
MEPARHPFPVSSTARTIGEQKAKVKSFPGKIGAAKCGNRDGCVVRPGIRHSNPTLRLWFRRTQQSELLPSSLSRQLNLALRLRQGVSRILARKPDL